MKIKENTPKTFQNHFDNSDELCEYISDLCGGVSLLAFSRGKDSVVAWLKMRRYFKKIVPYFLYSIPPRPMTFEEESLRYYEDFFQTEIIRLPHPAIYRFWIGGVFTSPLFDGVVADAMKSGHVWEMDYEDITDMIKSALMPSELPEIKEAYMPLAYSASGVRSADSPIRHTAIKKYGPVNHNKKTFMPVYDYKKADMIKELDESGVKLPIDYEWFGRTYDGIDYRFTSVLKEKSPADYERVKAAYPLVEVDIMRMKYREEYYNENK